jgi:hypothetical protein
VYLLAFNFKVATDFGLVLLFDFVVVSLLAFKDTTTKPSKRTRPKSVDTLKLKANKYTQTTKEHPLRQNQKTRTTTKAKNIAIKKASKGTTTKSSNSY